MAALNRFISGALNGIAVIAGLIQPAAAAQSATVPLEYAVKANYLYKFAPFVTWPDKAVAPGAPFTICLLGETGFGPVLDEAVRGESVNGHPVAVRRLDPSAPIAPCQILFVGRSGQAGTQALRSAATYPVLTVTDRDHGLGGGMIDFVLRRGRVRFAIDAAAARSSGLQISSKLLALAVSVNGR